MGATLDAGVLRSAMSGYLEALRTHREEIDSLNVFPVPDGDTGTNLLMTQEAVEDALTPLPDAPLPAVGEAISGAALLGARGNSGVILSQVLRGLCGRLCRADSAGVGDLAEALQAASDQARRAVADPADGTMLSVLADAAAAAASAAGDDDAGAVVDAAFRAAEASLARTPDLLPALAEAGVVDAGGMGIVLLLDAVRAAVKGVARTVAVGPRGPVGEGARDGPDDGATYGFEVMYLLEGPDEAVPDLRRRLAALGDSVVVVGGGGLYNVHVHTDEPGGAVEEGIGAGRPRGIRIASLDQQVARACLAGEARAVRIGEGSTSSAEEACGLVAVVPGRGAAALFASLGARVVAAGPEATPSAAELSEALEAGSGAAALLLPNHPDVLLAAERAAGASGREVRVVPTRSVVEGLAAATAFNPEADLEENASRARRAAARVISVEVTAASRPAATAAGRVRGGQFLGLAGGEVRAVGSDPTEVALEVLREVVTGDHELLTALTGNGMDRGERVAAALARAFPDLEVEVHPGGQPRHALLIGIE